MTTYSLPTWFNPASVEVQWQPEVRSFSSPYGGATQALDLLGGRWRIAAQLPPCAPAAAAEREAWLARLQGGVHRVSLHHLARPYPRGTARGTLTLSASAAQGASSLAVTGALAGANLISGGSFEIDSNADGLADGWVSYTAGAVSGHVHTRVGGFGTTYSQRSYVAGSFNVGDRVGVLRTAHIPVTAGVTYALSAHAIANAAGVQVVLYIGWHDAANTFISASPWSATGVTSWTRLNATAAVAPVGAARAYLYLWAEPTGAQTDIEVYVDNVQFEAAASSSAYAGLPTLLAGDMLGSGGQLFMVAEDANFTDAGTATVSIVNRSRAALSSGASVTWAKPTAEFMLTALQGVPVLFQPGIAAGPALEFMEAWS